MTHKEIVKRGGGKIITKYLTDRHYVLLGKRRVMMFQMDHVKVILRPKMGDSKLQRQIEKCKLKLAKLRAQVK